MVTNERRERYAEAIFGANYASAVVMREEELDAVMAVADAEQAKLLYPLSQHTPESARALAEDIGASEDSLLVAWIRAEAKVARVEALANEWIEDTGLVYGGDYGEQVLAALGGAE